MSERDSDDVDLLLFAPEIHREMRAHDIKNRAALLGRPPLNASQIVENELHDIHAQLRVGHGDVHVRRMSPAEESKAMSIFTLLVGLMVVAQLLLVYWRKRHYKSYQQITLVGLWGIPFLFATSMHFYKLLFAHSLWTIGSSYTIYKATRRPLPDKTPRLVYSFFFYAHRLCHWLALLGYGMVVADFFKVSAMFGTQDTWANYGAVMLCGGLYFGILSRDCAEMCTDRMANSMGFGKKNSIPRRQYDPTLCLVCCDPLNFNWALMHSRIQSQEISAAQTAERTVTLSCGHAFHDFCVRGWTIVGKKETCPYCGEKVSLKAMLTNPWESQSLMWSNLLDAIRYLIVWNPVIVGFTQLVLWEFGIS